MHSQVAGLFSDKLSPFICNGAFECSSGRMLIADLHLPGSGTLRELPAGQQFHPGCRKQQLCGSSQPHLSYHADVLTELRLTANILIHTLAENRKRKFNGSKYSHAPDKLLCTPLVHSQPPAWFQVFLKSYSTM